MVSLGKLRIGEKLLNKGSAEFFDFWNSLQIKK